VATDQQWPQRQSLESDRALAVRLKAGDRTALNELFEREVVRLVALTTRVMGERGLAEDVVQDVFATLWSRPHIYEPERGGLRNWLYIRCRGLAIDRVRSQVARDRREAFVLRGVISAHHDEYDLDDDRLDIEREIAALPADYRRLIELTFFGGLSYCAAAVLLDIPEGTAKTRVRRALSVLRGRLSEPLPTESESPSMTPQRTTTAA
jgi:RNA polymerase sigma-70 factor (ECF subfamily)